MDLLNRGMVKRLTTQGFEPCIFEGSNPSTSAKIKGEIMKDIRIFFRGSISDLITDLKDVLTQEQMLELKYEIDRRITNEVD